MSAQPQPTFTLVTATYNCAEPLRRTLESLTKQDADLFEHVIVDGASSDETLDVIKAHVASSAYTVRFISEKDAGIYDAMNKGIALSKGRFLLFLNAGDLLMPGILQKVTPCLPASELSMLYGNALMDGDLSYGAQFNKCKIAKLNICHQAIFYGRKIFDKLGYYDLQYRVFADHVFNIKCFSDSQIERKYIDVAISNYELGGFSSCNKDEAFLRDYDELVRHYLGWRALLIYRIFHLEKNGPPPLRALIRGAKDGLKIVLRRPRSQHNLP